MNKWAFVLLSTLLGCGRTAPLKPVEVAPPLVLGGDADGPLTEVFRATHVLQVAAGGEHSCAVDLNRRVKCWGRNNKGQLGNNSTIDSSRPVEVAGLVAVRSIAVGLDHSCAIDGNGEVWCWGSNQSSKLGTIWVTESLVPRKVEGLGRDVRQVALGDAHTCALLANGAVKCAGPAMTLGIGSAEFNPSWWFVQVPGLESGVRQIVVQQGQACALSGASTVHCWGWVQPNSIVHGEDPGETVWRSPRLISGFAGPLQRLESPGLSHHHCALLIDGRVQCWGRNVLGELGSEAGESVLKADEACLPGLENCARFTATPSEVEGAFENEGTGLLVPIEVLTTMMGSCVVTEQGSLLCWGSDSHLSGVNYLTKPQPQLLPRDGRQRYSVMTQGVTSASINAEHGCAVVHGEPWCWGKNNFGQAGGTEPLVHPPTRVELE